VSRKSQIQNTLCLSDFSRTKYYQAVCCLRLFAYFEIPKFSDFIRSLGSPNDFFNGSKNKISFEQKLPEQWKWELKQTLWNAYAYGRNCRFTLQEVFSKLVRQVCSPDLFNEDFSLSEKGIQFRNKLRETWEHEIEIEYDKYRFSSSQQLLDLILDRLTVRLERKKVEFLREINELMTQFFSKITIDGQTGSEEDLREGLGFHLVPDNTYELVSLLKTLILNGEHQKKASQFIEDTHLEPIETLVSNSYMARLTGLAKINRLNKQPKS
jgi:hypothetical protein